MVFTLHRYIFRDLVKTFLLASLVLSLILGLGIMLRPLRQFGVDPARVPELIFCTLPITLTMVMPIAALFSTTLNYGRLAVDNEINACRSSGIGLMTLIYPALTLALLVGMATLLLAFHVIPVFTQKFDAILKADAEAILYRNITKTGSLGDFGGKFSRYRLHADRAYPEQHRLENFVVIQTDGDKIERVISARDVTIHFQSQKDQQHVRLRLSDCREIERDEDKSYVREADHLEIRIPIPSLWKDDVKFKKLAEMQQIRRDMRRFKPVRELLERYRSQLITESFFQWCRRQLQKNNYVDLSVDQDRLRIHAQSCRIKPDKPPRRDLKDKKKVKPQKVSTAQLTGIVSGDIDVYQYYPKRPQRWAKHYEAEEARLTINPLTTPLSATLLLKRVTRHFAGDPRDDPHRTYAIANIEIPAAVKTPVFAYSLDEVLAGQAHPRIASDYLESLYRKLHKLCNGLETEITVELHSRLAFGVSCVVLVVFGAALGIILRSGHLLSAFGVSCVPAVLCLTTIFTGKHIAEDSSSGMVWGILFLWSGIAVVTVADGWIFRNLLKR